MSTPMAGVGSTVGAGTTPVGAQTAGAGTSAAGPTLTTAGANPTSAGAHACAFNFATYPLRPDVVFLP